MRKLSPFLLGIFVFTAMPAFAAPLKVWAGTTSSAWSIATNWVGGVAPVTGDRLLFPLGAQPSVTNDLGPMVLDGLEIQGGYTIAGSAITLTSSSSAINVATSGSIDFQLPITFPPNATVTSTGPSGITFDAQVTLTGGAFTIASPFGGVGFQAPVVETSPTSMSISATNFGALATIGNSGAVSLALSGTYLGTSLTFGNTGPAAVFSGDARLEILMALGSPVERPIDLRIAGPNSKLQFESFVDPNPVYAGAIALTGQQDFLLHAPMQFTGAITGTGGILLEPGLPMTLSHASNTFSGAIQVQSGASLSAGATGAFGSGDLSIWSGGVADVGAFAQHVGNMACAGTLAMTIGTPLSVQSAALLGCALRLTIPAAFGAPSSNVPILLNLGHTSTVYTFTDLPEMAPVVVNGATYHITYRGGAGNDIVLLAPNADIPIPQFTTHLQDMWWSPAENGWGMSLLQHNDTIFGAMYVYDASGMPTWLVMPGGAWDATHKIYTGSVYTPSGSPFFTYDASHFLVGGAKGTVQIAFQDANNAVLDYSIGVATGRKLITREIFANGSVVAPDRADLWWGGLPQNGWGITILQQASTLFPVWFTYDANGVATWYVMPGGTWTASDTYEGRVYRTTGSPWVGAQYDATKLQVFDVGTYRIQFTGDGASFTYTVDGHSGTIPLVKEPF